MVSGNVFADLAAMAGKFYAESEKVFEAQRDTIIEIAKKESCVIIGRCASSVLRGINADALSVFIYADDSDRIRRISENNGLDMKAAERKMHKTDHMRKRYFDFYSETLWGEKASYDIMLSSSKFGIDGTVDIIQKAVADKMKA